MSRRLHARLLAAAALTLVATAATSPSALAADSAHIIAERHVDARVIDLTIATPAFSAPTEVQVDLPVGYDAKAGRRWPVTYYLAGTNHHAPDFNTEYDGERLTRAFPSIVVSPNGDSGYWSDWFNGGASGPPMYETFVIDQLIPLIDARFRTTADRAGRAVLGESMGGYGTMMFAARHPDVFAAASSLSGAVDSNLAANGAVLSASPALQGGAIDAIYGPRATQEVRWRGHNPVDLAGNLHDVDLQVRSAEGIPDPSIGEGPSDAATCPVERGVFMASTDLHQTFDALGIAHVWKDYGGGCHSVANFEREISDSLPIFERVFASPRRAPATFSYRSVEPHFDIWGWHVDADPARALEFLELRDTGARGTTLTGSGRTEVTTPPLFAGVRAVGVRVAGATTVAIPDRSGRIRFAVDLGAANRDQQYTPGATTPTATATATVAFVPHARAARPLRLSVRPRRVRPGCHRFRFHATTRVGGSTRAVRQATVTFGHRPAAHTDRRGYALVSRCLRPAGHYTARAHKAGYRGDSVRVGVSASRRRSLPRFTG